MMSFLKLTDNYFQTCTNHAAHLLHTLCLSL